PSWTSAPSDVPAPISPCPLTGTAWSRPGPVSEAADGPLAAAGAIVASAASVPAVASTRSLRMWLPFVYALQPLVHRPRHHGSLNVRQLFRGHGRVTRKPHLPKRTCRGVSGERTLVQASALPSDCENPGRERSEA